jgi:hypothetical protein
MKRFGSETDGKTGYRRWVLKAFFIVGSTVCSLALSVGSVPASAQEGGQSNEYLAMYEALLGLRPDAQRVATLSVPLVIRRPGFQLILTEGQVSLLDIGGRVVGAAFSGTGSATVLPAIGMEQQELKRKLGSTMHRAEIEAAAILYSGGGLPEFESTLTFAPGTVEGPATRAVERANRFLKGEESGEYDSSVMAIFLNQLNEDFLHVHLDPKEGPGLFYRYDERSQEEATFGREGPRDRYETLTRFHPEEDYLDGSWLEAQDDGLVAMDSYELAIRVDDSATRMWFDGSVTLTPKQAGAAWVPMSLFEKLEIREGRWADGSPLKFYRPEKSGVLWIRLPESAEEGQSLPLHLTYGGDLGDRSGGWYGLLSPTGWYPRVGGERSTFDLTFHTPSKLHVVASGDLVSREERGDTVITRWVTGEKAIHASFNVGPFDVQSFAEDPSVPPLTIQVQKEGHNQLQDRGAIQQGNVAGKVGLDVSNSIRFYEEVYGPLSSEEFMVAEIPYPHGQAFPGMVQLSYVTYFNTSAGGEDESFRAHEVAHQWWGLGVRGKTPRDVWIEEGLAEFSSLWYMLKVKVDPIRVYELLDEKKEALLELRDEAGPMWLGRYHLQNAEDGGLHYSRIVYDKGAWVIHMLRILLMDLDSQDDQLFADAIKSVYQTYRGRELSTAEFQQHLEGQVGFALDWFFQQWVYGTAIPTYRFSYTGRETEDGEYQLWGKVIQEDVPEDFTAFVPVLIDFGEQGFARVRMEVRGRESTVEFPVLPGKPENVIFNDLRGVLAHVKTEKWSGPDPWGSG